jgi:hypothetical protein
MKNYLAVSALQDASNQTIVAKNRRTGVSLVMIRLFVMFRRFACHANGLKFVCRSKASADGEHSRHDPGSPMSRQVPHVSLLRHGRILPKAIYP